MSGLHKSLAPSVVAPPKPSDDTSQPLWPNPADFTFNYYNLLNAANLTGIANVSAEPCANLRIAIIGAGYAGLTAAKELFRCGFNNITIYEATDRIGGRGYTVQSSAPGGSQSYTPFEMGAMRIPFFCPDPTIGNCTGNSCIGYYANQYPLVTQPFPDPGHVLTGIYMNGGYGPTPVAGNFIGMQMWQPGTTPPDPALLAIYNQWVNWSTTFTKHVALVPYGNNQAWVEFWQSVIQAYDLRSFRDVALMPALNPPQGGDFGGLGLTTEQADLFYTIGAGDGSWGAFFDISALYPIRTLLFGFSQNHQMLGCLQTGTVLTPGLRSQAAALVDSRGTAIQPLALMGLEAVPDGHLIFPVNSAVPSVNNKSLYDAISANTGNGPPNSGVNLFVLSPVTQLDYDGNAFVVTSVVPGGGLMTASHDALIVTPPGWAQEMSIAQTGPFIEQVFLSTPDNVWPGTTAWHGLDLSHNITSAKVFFRLNQRFWEVDPTLPQVVVTDTFLQDAYAWAVDSDFNGNPSNDPGVLLCSYTWEDDANKLLASPMVEQGLSLAQLCLNKLDDIMRASRKSKISTYVDKNVDPVVWQWAEQPYYRSCAKLYRPGSFDWNYAQLTWNQEISEVAKVYFAGEFASLEGGWIEPAMRSALDAVINLIENNVSEAPRVFGATFPLILKYPVISGWKPTMRPEAVPPATPRR
jgi:tryptophan 2-monooxygenase